MTSEVLQRAVKSWPLQALKDPQDQWLNEGDMLLCKLARFSIDVASGGLQDKQDKFTATTAKICKNELWGLIGCEASIYLLSEAIGPLFEVATLTGFEPVLLP